MGKPEGRFGWRGKVALGLLLAALLFARVDTISLTPGKATASAYLFSVAQWEVTHIHLKWLHLLWETLLGRSTSREEGLVLLDEYLVLARRVQKEKDRLEGLHLRRSGGPALGALTKEKASNTQEYLSKLVTAKEKLRARSEAALEAELGAALAEEGLASRFGILLPPVDIRFDQPPTVLVISPRDRIQLTEVLLLSPDLRGVERDRLEKAILADYNLSALVDNLAGLATYPSLVSDLYTMRTVLRTAAHEWLHAYLFFRPLGRHINSSETMFTINETAAELAGRELGDIVFAGMGGDLTLSSNRYPPAEDRDPNFTREMRETRLGVERLLAQGEIEEAERYMRERSWRLRLGGYYLRKLNQAYFAFRGRYAEGPASLSPIGDQIKELRDLHPNVGSFVKSIAGVSSHQEFLDLLESLRAQGRTVAVEAP